MNLQTDFTRQDPKFKQLKRKYERNELWNVLLKSNLKSIISKVTTPFKTFLHPQRTPDLDYQDGDDLFARYLIISAVKIDMPPSLFSITVDYSVILRPGRGKRLKLYSTTGPDYL